MLVLSAIGLVCLCATTPAHAGTVINVTSTLDLLDGSDGKCTLREAIIAVNTQSPSGGTMGECPAGTGNDTINLGLSTFLLANGALSITKDVNIAGASMHFTLIDANGVNTHDRGLDIGSAAHVNLSSLGVLHGQSSGDGGGIRTVGWLTLTNVMLANNSGVNGGGLAVLLPGQAVLNGAEFDQNHASKEGGGLYDNGAAAPLDWSYVSATSNSAEFDGGGITLYNGGPLNIDKLGLYLNQAPEGGGIASFGGGLTLQNAEIRGNLAGDRGAGIVAYTSLTMTDSLVQQNSISTTIGTGGGIHVRKTSFVNLNHVSVLSNTAVYGGGIYNEAFGGSFVGLKAVTIAGNHAISEGGGIYNNAPINLTNVTLSGNTTAVDALAGEYGGAIYHRAGTATLLNTTIADNFAGFFNVGASVYVTNSAFMQVLNTIIAASGGYTCLGTVTSLGHNLDQSLHYCNFGSGDITGQDPKLGPLHDNGGAVTTRALLRGSPAVDQGNNIGCPATDARDFARPIDGDGNGSKVCDIGAFEAGPQLYLPLIRR